MKITEFFKGMLSQFSRTRLQDEMKSNQLIYSTMVMPSLKLAEQMPKFKNPVSITLAKELQAYFKGNGDVIAVLNKNFEKLEPIYDAILVKINEEFGERVIPAAFSARTATMVRIIGVLGFLNNYVMGLLNALAHYECQAAGSSMATMSDVTPGELERIQTSMVDFAQLLRALTSVNDPVQALTDIPDVPIENEDVLKAFGMPSVDPFNVFGSGLGFRGSPMLWLGMQLAERQNERYKKNEAQKRALEKRLLTQKRAMSGTPSAQVEQELEVLTSTIARLSEKMRNYERGVQK